MKLSQFSKYLWATTIAIGMGATLTVPTLAQTGTDTAPSITAPSTTNEPVVTDTTVERDGFDWGWLGLLGLLGLAGLKHKPEDRTVYRDPNADATRTTTARTDYNR